MPAATQLAEAYDVAVITVNLSAIIFSLTYIPMSFVAIYMYQHMRPSVVFRIGCANAIFGGWLRMFSVSTQSFAWILVGFIVISLSGPILFSAITLLCNTWLRDDERTKWI